MKKIKFNTGWNFYMGSGSALQTMEEDRMEIQKKQQLRFRMMRLFFARAIQKKQVEVETVSFGKKTITI